MKTKLLFQRLALVVLLAMIGSLQGFAQTYYSKVTVKLGTVNDLGAVKLGGKVYVGTTAEEAASCVYEYTSECAQALEATDHVYYLYAQPDEGFELAGWSASAGASSGFNSTANPYMYKVASVKSTDEAAPTEKTMYGVFKYKAENKPTTAYTSFSVVGLEQIIDEAGKKVNVPVEGAGMVGVTFGENQTSCNWVADNVTSETHSANYVSTSLSFPYTIFAKANPGYEFLGFASSSTSTSPSNAAKGETGYYSSSYTKISVSSTNLNFPGLAGLPDIPRNKAYYAIFKKLEQMDEPTGTTSVEVTEVKGTTELVEGSVNKNFSVDLVLNEDLPYDKPGSDKNAKPAEILKQFVTVTGANGNNSEVASYSLTYEATDLGEGGTSGTGSFGTLYSCHTIRLFFPYGIKADTYTVHLPYGLYTTKAGNKTPTYEFTINVKADENPYLTIKSQLPTEGMTIKYVKATQTKEPDNSKGEFDSSKITAAIEFNEVVESIDESKKDGVTLVNTTEGVNYKPLSVLRDAAIFGKVSGAVSIAFPELVNGSYTLTIPAGLFVGAAKTNEEITVHFTVTGFSTTLQPYTMVTDEISPKDKSTIEKLQNITISYKGEFGDAKALIGDASKITVKGYTEVIQGEGEGANAVRTYYPVETTPSAKVENGKLIVSFSPVLRTGKYEVAIPAGMAANMEPGTMTMAEKVNAGYAETPAYGLSFNVEGPDLWVGEHEVYYAPFDYATQTQGTPTLTTYNIVKEGETYYLTGLLDASEPAYKIPLVAVDANTLTFAEGGFSNDNATYNIQPLFGQINFVLDDDDQVTVPNKGLLYLTNEEDDMQMFVFASTLETEEPELNTVPLVGSNPADGDLVASLYKNKITLVYQKPFAQFDPAKDPKAACSLKDVHGNEISITAVNHYNVDDIANEIDFVLAAPTAPMPLAPGTYTLTFDAGVMQGGNIVSGIYTNAAAEITFSVGTEMEVPMAVTDAKYATFIAPFAVAVPEGVTASTVAYSKDDNSLVLNNLPDNTIPANTPVVLQSETSFDTVANGVAAPDFDPTTSHIEGLLVGVYQDTPAPVGSYVLQNQGKVAFYIVKEEFGQPTINAYRCYLQDGTAAGAPAFFFTEDDATAINGINAEIINAEGIYNVNGVRMNSLQKGLNIIKTANGTKKIMIK